MISQDRMRCWVPISIAFTLVVVKAGLAADTRPFRGKAHAIPGKIEAENYDEGDAEKAYHDSDEENLGADYRGKTQVDIEERKDASNGYGVGWTRKGEWLVYSIQVNEAGRYRLSAPVASNKKGGTFHLEIADKDISGPIDVPDTGSWQKLRVITKEEIMLPAGAHQLRVVMDEEGPSGSIADIDYFEFARRE
jgi:Carbohydrate binding module (family 6)